MVVRHGQNQEMIHFDGVEERTGELPQPPHPDAKTDPLRGFRKTRDEVLHPSYLIQEASAEARRARLEISDLAEEFGFGGLVIQNPHASDLFARS